jgi:alpha-mannosidase
MGGRSFSLVLSAISQANDPFVWNGHEVTSPHLAVRFAEGGGLSSVRMIDSGRELAAGNTIPLNTFLFGEDVPAAWDNWDIDADLQLKLKPELSLVDQCVAARGPLQFRLRQTYTFGRGSRLIQDVVVHARHTRIDFETLIEWRESHRFLSVVFPLAVHAPSARHEIQFGHIERPTHVNTSEDRARFEVCQHKWTDLSENRFGVALLNDGKYGVSVRRGTIKLSLHKGGCHPDARGDAGDHMVTYSLFPHNGAFAAESVVRPAYELNITPTMLDGAVSSSSLLTVDAPNIVLETVKPAADGRGYIVRLYECERQATRTTVRFARSPVDVWTTNLLEEQSQSVPIREGAVELDFRPFEIKTIRVIA